MQDGYVRRVRVISNYDGDTIRADIDLGFGQWSHNQTFRLYGINTPELRGGTAETKQAGRDAKEWLEKAMSGKTVYVRSYKGKSGKYGRYLAEVFVNGVNLNTEMVRLGLAEEYMKG